MTILTDPDEAKVAFDECGVPHHIRKGLIGYLVDRTPVGGFLTAVLSNNLREAFATADEKNRANLYGIVKWLYWHAPSIAWGSPERVAKWLHGTERKIDA